MAACLTCEEIEQKICDLADEISALTGCQGIQIKEDDTSFDYTPQIEAKLSILKTYQELHKAKCVGAMSLYEFVHTPCVKPARCVGATCKTPSDMRQGRRRYRR